jgi:hypothetical protein
MFDSQIVHPKNSIPPRPNKFIKKEPIPQLMKIKNAPSLGSLLSNMEMNMVIDMGPCNSFKNRNSTSVCANCMFNLEDIRSKHFSRRSNI